MAEEELRVKIKLPEPQNAPVPEVANYFHFSHAGAEVQMLVGYIDPRVVAEMRANPEAKRDITPTFLHRISITPIGFAIMRSQLDEIIPKYDASQAKEGRGAKPQG